jgi:hypothetical protein
LICIFFLFNRNLVPTFLNTIYAHDPSASLLNFDPNTLKFANPLSVFYLDSPSKELVEQIVQGSTRLTAAQVPEFVGLAATILKAYKARQNNKDANDVCSFNLIIIYEINLCMYVFFYLENKTISKIYFKIFK